MIEGCESIHSKAHFAILRKLVELVDWRRFNPFWFVSAGAAVPRAGKSGRAVQGQLLCPRLDEVRTFFKDKPAKGTASRNVLALPIPLSA
jgi:hypothetical protein